MFPVDVVVTIGIDAINDVVCHSDSDDAIETSVETGDAKFYGEIGEGRVGEKYAVEYSMGKSEKEINESGTRGVQESGRNNENEQQTGNDNRE